MKIQRSRSLLPSAHHRKPCLISLVNTILYERCISERIRKAVEQGGRERKRERQTGRRMRRESKGTYLARIYHLRRRAANIYLFRSLGRTATHPGARKYMDLYSTASRALQHVIRRASERASKAVRRRGLPAAPIEASASRIENDSGARDQRQIKNNVSHRLRVGAHPACDAPHKSTVRSTYLRRCVRTFRIHLRRTYRSLSARRRDYCTPSRPG